MKLFFLVIKALFGLRCVLRKQVGLGLLLAGLPAAGWGQVPAFGPAVAVGTYAGSGKSLVAQTAIDAQGYVYATGSFQGTVQFGSFTLVSSGGFTQGFVAKLDGAGTYQWVRAVEGQSHSASSSLVVDAAGIATIGGVFNGHTATFGPTTLANSNATYYTADIFVAQLDPAGNWLWATRAGGLGYDGVSSLALDAAGAICLAGSYASATATFGATTLTNSNPATTTANSYDVVVAKLTPQGSWLWARSGGGGADDASSALAVDATGNMYLTGLTQGVSATFGSFSVAGAARTNDAVLVAKLDANGTWLWATTGGGGINNDDGGDITLDPLGNAYITGRFSSPTATFGATTLANGGYGGGGYGDVFVAKLNAAGSWQWAVRAGSSKDDTGTGIAFDGAGRLLVAGLFGDTSALFGTSSLPNTASGTGGTFNPVSIFLAYLSPAGAWLGAVASQGGGDQEAISIAVDTHGNASLGGSFQGTSLTLGTVTLAGAGNSTARTGFVTLVPMVPTIYSFAPGSGAPGQVVSVTGTGFAGVTQVLFNGVPAAAFTVQSATRLLATVPAGVTAGPVSVHTSISAGSSGAPFQPVVLAVAAAFSDAVLVWPNPAGVAEPWQLRLSVASATVPTRAEVRNLLGQIVFQALVTGQAASLAVPRLAPGSYQLTLLPAGQPASQHRVLVAE